MKLATTLAAIALTTSTAFANGYNPPQEPEPPTVTERGDKTDLLVPLAVILGIAILATRNSEPNKPPCVTDQAYSGEKLDPYIVYKCD